ncbi:MAG TPA: LON peptidase substrate-binding domain-containing protein [Microthrixaceae bacterium]|nr:LON peptidase substrate-binding domain-containing protein [Microthrixaceae bacterium]HMR95332.1 LON peptidase substrate-binding domain-containing protein [Microthrixaceae bacterium]HNB96226.1 LON peptidase substrate-binding domain-containing protein [Microthrixaceae bacterium]HNE37969.1 LON peptidase substrate-binding domain-containing protein [Microthrixaceae bacterium]HNG23672.1 LON peptidase substrate-binding domain-containing protein [Microthrixaceae bacterium]
MAPDPTEMAMFPLSSVLLPTMLLPLHVFEDRYRVMVDDVLRRDPPEFGVVLIERGSEVGGGDVRTTVGCTARVLDAERSPDGRWALLCVGEHRLRVREWLADDPYPRARTERWPDPDPQGPSDERDALRVLAALRRVVALGSELGGPSLPEPIELSDDPVERSYQLGVLSPLGALDRLDVLRAPGPAQRLELLSVLLEEHEEVLRAQLALGD